MKCGVTHTKLILTASMLQKKAVRTVCNVSYLHQTNVLFLELYVLKVFDLIELKTAMITYKVHKNYLPCKSTTKMLT